MIKSSRKTLGDQEYYLHLPRKLNREETHPVFVWVHGFKENGKQGGLIAWQLHKVGLKAIVISPTFPDGTLQYPQWPEVGNSAQNMRLIFEEIRSQYKTQPKFFLAGISAGAQFVHRFALQNPDLLMGWAAHSAGAWTLPDGKVVGLPSPDSPGWMAEGANKVPLLVTCGKKDHRINLAKTFVEGCKEAGFQCRAKWLPEVKHELSNLAIILTFKFFEQLTGVIRWPK